MEIVRCEKLSKYYGSGQTLVTALDQVDLSVDQGEFVAIIGSSGSGKSTLLHMLGGVDRPSGGKVWIEGTELAALSEKQSSVFRRRKVGIVYQFYNLIPSINIRQNILLPMLLDGSGSPICPASSPADSSREPQLPGRWSIGPRFCWRMNPQGIWTGKTRTRFWDCLSSPIRNTGRPFF